MADFDVIVIGAGNGGLTAAASLARKGVRVLVLERHNIPGGCATSFCRGRFEFEVALHQLSGLGTPEKPGPLRGTLERAGVLDKLEFVPMSDLYRVVWPGKIDITLRPDWQQVVDELSKHFPGEKKAIADFYDMIRKLFTEVIGAFYMKDPDVNREKYPLYFKYALMDSQTILDQYFKDPLLKAVVAAYWGYLGLPPSHMSVVDFASLIFSYIEFLPFHLKGGSQAISNALASVVLDNGGAIYYNCGAKKIVVKNGVITGVVTEDGDEISTNCVISNASKIATYLELIGKEHLPESQLQEVLRGSISISAFCVYMGLDCEPRDAGIPESTNFIMNSADMDMAFRRMSTVEIDERDFMLMSCFDLITPDFSEAGTSQAVLVTLKYGDAWYQVPPHQYAAEKYRVAEQMLKVADKSFPAMRDRIEELEISTPLTHLRYLGHPKGAIYGFEHYVRDSGLFTEYDSPIKGLYGAGSWMGYAGFQPTLESGIRASRAVLKYMKG